MFPRLPTALRKQIQNNMDLYEKLAGTKLRTTSTNLYVCKM